MARRKCVPLLRVLTGRESTPFLGDDVHEPWPLHLAHGAEGVHQRVDVVTLDRTEIPEAELLEEHTGGEEILHALLPLPDERRDTGERPRRVVDHRANGAA